MEELPEHDVRYFVRVPQFLGGKANPIIRTPPSFREGSAYATMLPDSWDEYRRRLPTKFQKDNARMIRRLSEIGKFEFLATKTASEFGDVVEAMLIQKERRYKQTGARNILTDTSTRAFYRGLAAAVSRDAHIHMSALKLGDEILATHLGAVYQGRFYYLFPTYAGERWAKFSPGRLLLTNLVQWAIANRLHTFDFTVGGEAYKEIWCDAEMPLYRMVQPLTIRGHFFAIVQAFVQWVRTNPRTRAFAMGMLRMLRP